MTLQERQEGHIKAWQASGLSQAAYCRDHGLNSKTFGNWLRTYRDMQKFNQPNLLIPAKVTPAAPVSGYLRLRCSGGGIHSNCQQMYHRNGWVNC